ncbi:hypothetical protein A8C56_21525 [Niabella ginsenosidivorans]|uniref:Enamine deaminase RidA n=1 Tax=Niabella ginsenosidivorans TaxID=1176587 RepID=A0A1A9IAP9_9BACT|nr:RidA family protein [Niabella ginsenosidivorans]ANH84129.1 hypothetical protein A8C56_21525 [Niabella ginsenosidivorans]
MRQLFSSGAVWEQEVGYSRAVKIGNTIEVSGTVAVDAQNNIVGEGDAYAQTIYILQKIQKVLEEAGAALNDVVRTRMFVTDINRWQEYGRAHGTFFGNIKPCASMVEVSRLIHPGYLIEIEATAILQP